MDEFKNCIKSGGSIPDNMPDDDRINDIIRDMTDSNKVGDAIKGFNEMASNSLKFNEVISDIRNDPEALAAAEQIGDQTGLHNKVMDSLVRNQRRNHDSARPKTKGLLKLHKEMKKSKAKNLPSYIENDGILLCRNRKLKKINVNLDNPFRSRGIPSTFNTQKKFIHPDLYGSYYILYNSQDKCVNKRIKKFLGPCIKEKLGADILIYCAHKHLDFDDFEIMESLSKDFSLEEIPIISEEIKEEDSDESFNNDSEEIKREESPENSDSDEL